MSAAIVREMLDVLNGEGGVEGALAWFAEDFEGVVPPELSAEPDSYRGHDGVRRYFDTFHEIVVGLCFDADELVDVAPDAVVARGRITGAGRESGIPIDMQVPMVMRLRDGKLVAMTACPTWEEAIALASK